MQTPSGQITIALPRSSALLDPLFKVRVLSLRDHLPSGTALKVIFISAGNRTDETSRRMAVEQRMLDEIDVAWITDSNAVSGAVDGCDQFACLKNFDPATRTIVLDALTICTDMIDLRLFDDCNFAARPADGGPLDLDHALWHRLYSKAGVQLPELRIISEVTQHVLPPLYDMSFIYSDDARALSSAWQEMFTQVRGDESLRNNPLEAYRYALSLAVHKLSLKVRCLDNRFGYPVDSKPIGQSRPVTCARVSEDLAKAEPLIRNIIEHGGNQKNAVLTHPVNGALTGIPRSGTSYLVSLMSDIPDTLVINEPSAVSASLMNEITPWGVARYYREIRRRIFAGLPIRNKMKQGVLIEDTAKHDQREWHTPDNLTEQFSLFTKSTLPYLVRIHELQRAIPEFKLIASVRNPYDTIASWVTSFDHLKNASIELMMVGNPNDAMLPGLERAYASFIANTTNLPVRRALYWRHLAEIILKHRNDLMIVRYEDLVADPLKEIRRICEYIGHPQCGLDESKFVPSENRSKKAMLSSEDLEAINHICTETALQFGYT